MRKFDKRESELNERIEKRNERMRKRESEMKEVCFSGERGRKE